jgi:hypothetical protein
MVAPDENEVMKLLIVRELVRTNAEIIKATGFDPFDIGSEINQRQAFCDESDAGIIRRKSLHLCL